MAWFLGCTHILVDRKDCFNTGLFIYLSYKEHYPDKSRVGKTLQYLNLYVCVYIRACVSMCTCVHGCVCASVSTETFLFGRERIR